MSTLMTDLHTGSDVEADLASMEVWTAWVSKLMTQAAAQAVNPRTQRTLAGAAEDAAALRDAFASATAGWLDDGQIAVLRSIYGLWADNLERFEQMAATVAPEWHRMWRGRSASARLA
jgi:hypothetical protein